jgi:hypothetical protein
VAPNAPGDEASLCLRARAPLVKDVLRRYARGAGFARVEVLPIEQDFFRFIGSSSNRLIVRCG